jgi:hypothetical protein
MQKISQMYCSNGVNFFDNKIRNNLKLNEYTDINKPVLFFGAYRSDLKNKKKYDEHKGKCIFLLTGSDISPYVSSYKKNYLANIEYFKKMDTERCKIITISNYQSNLLKKHNIPHTNINIGWTMNNNFSPITKENNIYIYSSYHNSNYYGSYIYEEIYRRLKDKYNFIIACAVKPNIINKVETLTQKLIKSYPEPFDIYKKCFIGLRIVPFDGNANTVKEMGICGIRVIHNGNDKNCIPWIFNEILFNEKINSTDPIKKKALNIAVEDIIQKIEFESQFIGKIDQKLSDDVKNNISFDDNFLYI